MTNNIAVTFEVLVVVVAPLLALYLRSRWPLRQTVVCLVAIPVLWYFTYAPLHELSHVAGAYLAGGRVTFIKLIPRFWAGEFGHAWITSEGLQTKGQWLTMTSAPYVLDVASLVVGYLLLRRRFSKNPFLVGFTFMVLCLRPAFDLVCETVALIAGAQADLYHIEKTIGPFAIWTLLVLSIGLSVFCIASVLSRWTGAPEEPLKKSDSGGGPAGDSAP